MRLDRNLVNYLKAYFVPKSGSATIQNDLTPESGYTVSLGTPARPFDSLYVRSIVSTIHADTVNGKTANDIIQFIVGEEVDILEETPRIGFIAFGETTKKIYFGTETEWIELVNSYTSALDFTDLSDTPASYAGSGGLAVAVKGDLSGLEFVDVSTLMSSHTGDGTIHHLSGMSVDDHTQYVHNTTARTITAQHTFNPTSTAAPFILGANAQGQLISGLNADKLDGNEASAFSLTSHDHTNTYVRVSTADTITAQHVFSPATAIAPFSLSANAQGQLVTGLNADQLDGNDASAFSLSGHDHDADYVKISVADTITAVHTFSPGSVTAPFSLSANAQGQTVTGLKADQLNKSVTAGDGLSGGGALTSDITLSLDESFTPTWTEQHIFQPSEGATTPVVIRGNAAQSENLLSIQDSSLTVLFQVADNGDVTTGRVFPFTTDTYDLGLSNLLWRQIYASKINSILFVEETASVIGGWLIVTKDQGTFADYVSNSSTTIDFGKTMTPGDYVIVRAANMHGTVQAEYIQVGTLVSGTTYNVTRDVAGAHVTDPTWAQGTVFSVLGSSGDGRIELNAYDTPKLSVFTMGSSYNDPTEQIRLGDLNGWGDFSSETYGIAIGDFASGAYLTYESVSGLVVKGTINADDGYIGDLSITGDVTVADGSITAGDGTVVIDSNGILIANEFSDSLFFGSIPPGPLGDSYPRGAISGSINTSDYKFQWGAIDGVAYPNNHGTYLYLSTDSLAAGIDVLTLSTATGGSSLQLFTISSVGETYIGGDTEIFGDLTFPSNMNDFKIWWYTDTNLYRSAADTLKTDDSLIVDQDLTVNGEISGSGFIDPAAVLMSLPGLQGAWTHQTISASGLMANYPVQWTATVTNPSIGNGTLQSRYVVNGRMCHLIVSLVYGSTTSGGNGDWKFSLPLPVGASAQQGRWTGVATILKADGSQYERHVVINGNSDMYNLTLFPIFTQGSNYDHVAFNYPFTWATGDRLHFSISYEIHNGYGM